MMLCTEDRCRFTFCFEDKALSHPSTWHENPSSHGIPGTGVFGASLGEKLSERCRLWRVISAFTKASSTEMR